MRFFRRYFRYVTTERLLVLGYLSVTLVGAVLLSLPISSVQSRHQGFLDALFVATSGISTTGLTVVDIGSYYNSFGQVVLLCIVQIGGVGYMTFIVFLAHLLGMRLPFAARSVARESLQGPDYRTLGGFFVMVLAATLVVELTGAAILTAFWAREAPLSKAAYWGAFHSISAFCTAGFSVFPDNLMKYRDEPIVNLTVIIISIFGGIGFIVLYDLCAYLLKILRDIYPRKLSLHTKIVITTSLSVMFAGTVVVLLAERWPIGIGFCKKLTASAFQAVSASTTDGFNTIDIGAMSATSLTCIIVLMFTGASPGSTGGGIKTTTLALILTSIWSQLKGKGLDISLFKRRIPEGTVCKAFAVFTYFIIILTLDMIVLTAKEHASYLQILFETVSALGNTGLSTGITAELTDTSKTILIITMFIGRVGPLTAGFSLVGKRRRVLYEYATEDVFVG